MTTVEEKVSSVAAKLRLLAGAKPANHAEAWNQLYRKLSDAASNNNVQLTVALPTEFHDHLVLKCRDNDLVVTESDLEITGSGDRVVNISWE